jgi:hypothetical protein
VVKTVVHADGPEETLPAVLVGGIFCQGVAGERFFAETRV